MPCQDPSWGGGAHGSCRLSGPSASFQPWPASVPPPATPSTAIIAVRIIVRAIRGRATGQATSNRSSQSLPETRARRGFFVFRSEEHTSELQSLMRISYAVICLKKKNHKQLKHHIKSK